MWPAEHGNTVTWLLSKLNTLTWNQPFYSYRNADRPNPSEDTHSLLDYKAPAHTLTLTLSTGGNPPVDLDVFRDLIWIDKLARAGCGGILWAVFTGLYHS